MNNQTGTVKTAANPMDIFAQGARKGLSIVANNLLPYMVMAYVLTDILNRLGAMALISQAFGPVMGIFGLPGTAAIILLTTYLSSSAAIGITLSMLTAGSLSPQDVTIMMPAYYLLNAQVQYLGRLLGVAGVPAKYWPVMVLASTINACCAMLIMHWFFV